MSHTSPKSPQISTSKTTPQKSGSSIMDIVNLITKSGRGSRTHTVSSISSDTSGDAIINIINPDRSESRFPIQGNKYSEELNVFLEESIREILSTNPKSQCQQAVTEFLKNFVPHGERDLAILVKRILESEELWQEPQVTQIIRSIEAHNALVTHITAEAVGDIIEDYLKVPEKKCGALKQLGRYQADLRRLYYEKGCRLTQTTPKQAIINALMHERAGTGCVTLRGHGSDEEPITDRDILALCVAVKMGLRILALSIHHQLITDFGVWHIARMIKNNYWPVKHLDLRGNSITGNGATFLAEILVDHACMHTLILAENKIGNVGGLAINKALQKNTCLRVLDLSKTDLTMESVVAVIVAIRNHPKLQYLDLSRPLLFSQQEEPMIHMGSTLKVNGILKELHLQKFGITDYGIKMFVQGLMQNTGLLHLDLSCNDIVWDGVREIALFLQTNPLLQLLNIHANRIENPGAIDLAHALAKKNRTLKKLIVTSNNIESKGLCALVKSLEENPTLTHLHIWGNKLETTACVALAEVLQSGRLDPMSVDFWPYVVDGVTYLAKADRPISIHDICHGKP